METTNYALAKRPAVTTTRVDAHVKIMDDAVARRAKRRGLDAVVYAPHFTRWPTARERAAAFSDEDLLVVPAREIFTGDWRRRRHVLALDLERPIPDFLTLDGTMTELARQDAVVLIPHPEFATVSLDRSDVARYSETIDGVEVYNPKHRARHNRRANAVASETGLAPFGSSYAHLPGTVGEVWTAFEDRIESERDLLAAFRDGDRRVFRRDGVAHNARRHLEFAHLGWENTWKKFDRVVCSGMEQTHPDHPAYDGRFDDVRADG